MITVLKDLFRSMLTRPETAGHRIIGLGLPVQALWMALTLVSVSTSLLASGMLHMIPLPDDEVGKMVMISLPYSSPLIFAIANLGNAVLSVFIFLWVGRLFGGTGQTHQVLAVIVLWQASIVVLLVGLVLVGMVLPLIAMMFMLCLGIWAIWSMIVLLNVAHDFRSMAKAAGAFLVAAIGVPMGLSFFTGAIAALTSGVS